MVKDEMDAVVEVVEDDIIEIADDEERPKSPWKAFILTGLIASLFGAAGGGYGVYAGLKSQSPQVAEVIQTDLTPLETRLKALTDRVSAAEANVKQIKARPVPTSAAPSEPVDLSPLDARITALEKAPKPEIDPAALTALQAAQRDGFEWPDTASIEDRIADLETDIETASNTASVPSELFPELIARLEDLETQLKSLEKNTTTQLSAGATTRAQSVKKIEARLAALENAPRPDARVERVSILAFPKEAMIAAVEENVEGGLFKRALSKHVRVKDDDDPIGLIDSIEIDITAGRLESAIIKYDRLPDPVRAAGQAWYESVKASL